MSRRALLSVTFLTLCFTPLAGQAADTSYYLGRLSDKIPADLVRFEH